MDKMDYLHCLEDVEKKYGKGEALVSCDEKRCPFREECLRGREGKKE